MKAIIYARTSSAGTLENRQNTERQLADLRQYAKVNNYTIIKEFSEHISGSTKNEGRAILVEALTFAHEQECTVLCSELSRFGRAIWEILESVKWCADRKIDVFFQKEGLHILGENGEVDPIMAIYISCLGFCAQKEKENILYRLNSGRRLAIEKGVKMGRKKGSTKTAEQKKVQYGEVVRLLKKGRSVSEIEAYCKGKGIKASTSTIKRLKKEFL